MHVGHPQVHVYMWVMCGYYVHACGIHVGTVNMYVGAIDHTCKHIRL